MHARRHAITPLALAGLMLTAGAARPLAAQTIHGQLLELDTDRPVPDASVTLQPEQGAAAAARARSDRNGAFEVRAPAPGVYRLRVEKPGYRPAVTPALALAPGDEVGLTLRLLRDTLTLRPVVVTANNRKPKGRSGGFHDRMERNKLGIFITRDQIEKQRPFAVSDLLRSAPGLELVPSPRGFGYDVRMLGGCRPMVYLDGLPFPLHGESIDDLVSPNMLEGIEIYRTPAEVPAELQRPGLGCGVIALWTH